MNFKNQLPLLLKAMDNAQDGITISDATQTDNPLIYVNEGFLNMTGYHYDEVIGKNCRFLQGKNKDQSGVKQIRQALCKKEPIVVELLNYKKSGEPFWNSLSITPIVDENGMVTHFIGVQNDVSLQKEKEQIQKAIDEHKLITAATIEAQEKERQHIGRELHDNINQMLASAKLYLNMAADNEAVRMQMMQSSTNILNNAISEIRKLSHRLVGPQPDSLLLQDSLTELLVTLELTSSFKVSFTCENIQEEEIEENKKILIYRIVQEQINNIIKYSNAEQVAVCVREVNNCLVLNIKDDGVGFDATKKAKGIGLRNIETRLEMVNGNMRLITAVGKGCEMLISVPL